jgi:hypothetical protein
MPGTPWIHAVTKEAALDLLKRNSTAAAVSSGLSDDEPIGPLRCRSTQMPAQLPVPGGSRRAAQLSTSLARGALGHKAGRI